VQLFASYAEIFGAPQIRISLPAGARVSDVVSAVRALPGGEQLAREVKVAVNQRFAGLAESVTARDEIALIPPVAGG
jgi:molybdopterin converting factor small subunit